MDPVDITKIMAMDEVLMREGIPPDQRAFVFAQRMMAEAGVISYPLSDARFEAYRQAFRSVFPNAEKTGGWIGYGLAASLDDVRQVTVPLVFGTTAIHVYSLCGFDSHDAWAVWVRGRPAIADQTTFAAFDAMDFAYGVMDYQPSSPDRDGSAFFATARSNLEEIAKRLPESGTYQTLSQNIHLVAETAMKAVLADKGVPDTELRKRTLGHDLEALSARMAELAPQPDDDSLIASLLDLFPNYVAGRYQPDTRSRLQVVRNALAAQFMAASSSRRLVPDRNMCARLAEEGLHRDASFYLEQSEV